jgi:transcriptional regulator with GAF, ATPase, and Fis domain
MADGGTFYLNEVADATPEFQAKLLQVLERREIRRLGENEMRRVDFRLIAATNHNLDQRIRENHFRLDLYHRISEEVIRLPALRERTDDIEPLIEHFLTLISPAANGDSNNGHLGRLGRILAGHDWPGNVRELRSEVNRLWLASGGRLSRMVALASPDKPHRDRSLLLKVLDETGWNRREVARRLGVTEGTIRYRIKKFDLC